MSDARTLTAKQLVLEFTLIYKEALADQISDLDLAAILLDSGFFIITDPRDQELFFATSNHLDEFLLSVIPNTVCFVQDRLALWGKEALEFARANVSHPAFVDIFSSRLQYDGVLANFFQYDFKGSPMRGYLDQLQISSGFVREIYPLGIEQNVISASVSALQPALFTLAVTLKAHQRLGRAKSRAKIADVTSIRSSPSFINQVGSVKFVDADDRFAIKVGDQSDQIGEYKPVIDRALKRLVEARTFQRIDNRDRILAKLLSEYKDEIDRGISKVRIPILWSIGVEIENRLLWQDKKASEDERLEEDDRIDLNRLVLSHNLFLNCFPQSKTLINDIESTAAIYQRLDEAIRKLPGNILSRLSENVLLVIPETGEAISKAVDIADGVSPTKGAVAVRYGLLRGFLHAAGGRVLSAVERSAEKSVTDAATKSLGDFLRAEHSLAAVVSFFQNEASGLLKLGENVPLYFGYIRSLLKLMGLI